MFEAWWILVPVGGLAGQAFWATEEDAVAAATAGPGQMGLFFWDDQSGEGGRWREYRFPWLAPAPYYDTSMGYPQDALVEVSGHYPPVFASVGQTSLAEFLHEVTPPGGVPMIPPSGLPGHPPYLTAPDPDEPVYSPWGTGLSFGPTAYEMQNASSPWAPGAGYQPAWGGILPGFWP